MDRENEPKPGELYKHFKDKLYQIITVATHSETNEKMVVYQALYGDFKTYVRPLTMFMSKVDKEKYQEVPQEYRFNKITINEDGVTKLSETGLNETRELGNSKDSVRENSDAIRENDELGKVDTLTESDERKESPQLDDMDENQINPILLEFLEARTYQEKLSIVMGNKNKITDKLINDMAAALDCTVEDGTIDDRLSGFLFCLQTFTRFENNRLR